MKFCRHFITFAALALMTVASALFLTPMAVNPISQQPLSVLAFLIVAAALVVGVSIAAFLLRSNLLAFVQAMAFQLERQDKAVAA
jgi:hypothetical protein